MRHTDGNKADINTSRHNIEISTFLIHAKTKFTFTYRNLKLNNPKPPQVDESPDIDHHVFRCLPGCLRIPVLMAVSRLWIYHMVDTNIKLNKAHSVVVWVFLGLRFAFLCAVINLV
jgi:hypothetical protein